MSKADEMLSETFEIKSEEYEKNKLRYIEYKTNYNYLENNKIKFDIKNKIIQTDANIDMKILQTINEKVKELGWLDE